MFEQFFGVFFNGAQCIYIHTYTLKHSPTYWTD